MSEALLSLDQVTTYYGQMRILEGISLNVAEGAAIGAGDVIAVIK